MMINLAVLVWILCHKDTELKMGSKYPDEIDGLTAVKMMFGICNSEMFLLLPWKKKKRVSGYPNRTMAYVCMFSGAMEDVPFTIIACLLEP